MQSAFTRRGGLILLAALAAAAVGLAGVATLAAARPFITVASTTSTENSGLFAYILPKFTAKTGIDVHVVAKGTGQAIRIAQKGDADVLLVHHRPSEDKFVAQGYSTKRYDLMHNDFVIVGPSDDPARIGGLKDAVAALTRIDKTRAPFVSRGDDSGTNKKELGLWKVAGLKPDGSRDAWYRELGSGMGATLNTAAAMGAYTLADRGTWLSFKNRRGLKVLVEGDPRLFNPYGVMLVNPKRFPNVKAKEGQAFIDWLESAEGQQAIGSYRINGQVLFTPDVVKGVASK